MKLLTDVAEIERLLDSVSRRGATLQSDVHRAACSIMKHVAEHHDVRLVTRLIEAVPDMVRRNGIKSWFETFGPVTFDGKGVMYDGDKKVRVGDAIAKPFWKFKATEGTEYVPLDVAKALDTLQKRLKADAKRTGRDHSVVVSALMQIVPPANAPTVETVQ